MPIYEYRCSACGTVFEEWVKTFDTPDNKPCPKCGGDARKIISDTSFLLKGTGWYATQYGAMKGHDEGGPGISSPDPSKNKHDNTQTVQTSSQAESKPASQNNGASAVKTEAAPSSEPAPAPTAPATAAKATEKSAATPA